MISRPWMATELTKTLHTSSVPTFVLEYKDAILYSGTGTVPEF